MHLLMLFEVESKLDSVNKVHLSCNYGMDLRLRVL